MQNFLFVPFMQNALLAGSFIAIISAIIGYFVVLRGLSFASHALAHIGFAGATGAILLGVDPLYGLLGFTVASGVVMGYLGDKVRGRDIAIGIVLSFSLGLGALFLSLYTKYATQAFGILFGTILGIGMKEVWESVFLSFFCIVAICFFFRPLLFSSIDITVAKAKGVPVLFLSIIFFVILAVAVSVAVQVVGVLMIFTLILAPAATAQYLSASPSQTILLSIAFALFETWAGIILAYYISWPVSFFISTIAFLLYLSARLYAMVK